MSDTPKYTSATLSPHKQAELDRAVAAVAESIQQSVRNAVAAYREHRLNNRRRATAEEAARLISALNSLARLPHADQVAATIAQCRNQLVPSNHAATAMEDQLDDMESRQRGIAHNIAEIRAQIAEAQVTAEVDRLRTRMDLIVNQIQGLDRPVHERFDSIGLTSLGHSIRNAQSLVEARATSEAQTALAALQKQIQSHCAVVEQRRTEWQHRHDDAITAIETAKAKHDVYQAELGDGQEPACMRTVRSYLAQAHASLKAERFEEAQRMAGMVASDLESVNAVLRDRSANRLKVKAIMDAFSVAVDQMGGVLVKETDENGRIVRDFAHCFRQGIQIGVSQETKVSFILPGYPKENYTEDGRLVSNCGDARAALEKLREPLKAVGVEMTDVQWKNKPRRPREKTISRASGHRQQGKQERSK